MENKCPCDDHERKLGDPAPSPLHGRCNSDNCDCVEFHRQAGLAAQAAVGHLQAVVDAGRGVVRGRGRRGRVQLGPYDRGRGDFWRIRVQAVLEGRWRRGRTAPREGDVDAVASLKISGPASRSCHISPPRRRVVFRLIDFYTRTREALSPPWTAWRASCRRPPRRCRRRARRRTSRGGPSARSGCARCRAPRSRCRWSASWNWPPRASA